MKKKLTKYKIKSALIKEEVDVFNESIKNLRHKEIDVNNYSVSKRIIIEKDTKKKKHEKKNFLPLDDDFPERSDK